MFENCDEALCGSAKLIFYIIYYKIFNSAIMIRFISKYMNDSPIVPWAINTPSQSTVIIRVSTKSL